jgi:hypothetical protein
MAPLTRRQIEEKRTATAARYAEPGQTLTPPEIDAQRVVAVRVHVERQDWWEQWKAANGVGAGEFEAEPLTQAQEQAVLELAHLAAAHAPELVLAEQLRTATTRDHPDDPPASPERRARAPRRMKRLDTRNRGARAAARRRLSTQQNHTARRARRRATRERTTR